MPNTNPASRGVDEETLWLILLGLLVAAVVGPALIWSRSVQWLTEHQLIVPGSADPLIALPNAAGAGLDLRRAALVAVALLALALTARWRLRTTHEDRNPT